MQSRFKLRNPLIVHWVTCLYLADWELADDKDLMLPPVCRMLPLRLALGAIDFGLPSRNLAMPRLANFYLRDLRTFISCISMMTILINQLLK